MDDAQWIFKKDSADKKSIARSAKNKVRHTGCNLPSDYMTKKDISKLNGDVKTMNIRKPMSYAFFKTLAPEIAEEYLTFLRDEFHAKLDDISRVFKISSRTLSNYCYRRKIKTDFRVGKKIDLNVQAWDHFWNGMSTVEETNTDTPHTDREESDKTDISVERRTIDEIVAETPLSLNSMQIELNNVRDWDSLQKILSAFPLPENNSITIMVRDTEIPRLRDMI